jgi:SAM-dependent methyltransferase
MRPQDTPDLRNNSPHTVGNWHVRQQTHDQYTFPRVDFVEWVMSHVGLKGNETLLDLGCGTGRYYEYIQANHPDVTYTGIDTASTLTAEHPAPNRVIHSPMDEIPFEDGTFDVVMANHVMYYAANVADVVKETQRVLKPNGLFVASTSSVTTTPQFRELFRRAILLVSPPGAPREVKVPSGLHQRFALENGSRMLANHYFAVVRHDLPGAFVFDEVDPIMDYLESMRDTYEPQLPENISWDQVMLIMREQLTNLILTLDKLVVDKLTGVLIATNGGGFIEEFWELQQQQNARGDQKPQS